MSLATHVQTLGRGPGRSRSLNQSEAREAMEIMLSGAAAPEAIGALLMLLRMKGETSEEIAGLAAGAARRIPELGRVDLDWPSYAAGRSRGLPWFLLAARLVAMDGHRVLIHGWNGADMKVREGLAEAGVPLVDPAGAAAHGICYLPLEVLSPALFRLLGLRDVLGLRSCINTVCRMLNPGGALASVQGVFHPSYRLKQAEAAQALGWRDLSVIKGGGGEFERHPGKTVAVHGVRGGSLFEEALPPVSMRAIRLAEGPAPGVTLAALWSGAARDDFAEAVVLGTAELALATLGVKNPGERAQALWAARLSPRKDAA